MQSISNDEKLKTSKGVVSPLRILRISIEMVAFFSTVFY